MFDVFISYARSTEQHAVRIAECLRADGYSVWRDDEIPAHGTYGDVIEERLKTAKAVVVIWSADAAKSQWVRAEADAARQAGTLVQASVDQAVLPMPFNQIQCAQLEGWNGETDAPGWRKLIGSVASLVRGQSASAAPEKVGTRRAKTSVCVLPFANMSGEPEQEYFSDGISEDITTDLSKVSALAVTARNTAFTFKGTAVDVCDVAQRLGVSHVLEGSVRKAGNRVRITAQLIDGETGDHVWADRYDRDLTDIFAIQDEISKAIVQALQLKLLPEEKKAIETRGTNDVEAYKLYLMARQHWVSGTAGNPRREEAIVRVCRQATVIDPNYAQAWALMALAQAELRFWHGRDETALAAAERALSINPDLPEARCVKARYLEEQGRQDEARAEIDAALRLDPDSWEVNHAAAHMMYREGRIREAVPFFERAASMMDTDWLSPSMLGSCYTAMGEKDKLLESARLAFGRAERALATDPTNGAATAAGAAALAVFGEQQRAREWIQRGLLVDPDNLNMRYNFACALAVDLNDGEAAIDILQPYFEQMPSVSRIKHHESDPDFDSIRNHPRFKAMLAAAKTRLRVQGTH